MATGVLCVVPTSWPLHERVRAASQTWLRGCDRVVIGVSRAQLGTDWRPLLGFESSRAGVSATHNSHTAGSKDIWLPLRSSIQFAAEHNMSKMGWLLLAEDDAIGVVSKLNNFLQPHNPAEPWFFGVCRCSRSPGINLFSTGALQRLKPQWTRCNPIHRWRDKPNHTGEGDGAGDLSVTFCLERAGVRCSPALDTHGDMLISGMKGTSQKALLHLATETSANRRVCLPSTPCGATSCYGPGMFAFHAAPLKQPSLLRLLYAKTQSSFLKKMSVLSQGW